MMVILSMSMRYRQGKIATASALPVKSLWLPKTTDWFVFTILRISLVRNAIWHTNQCCIFLPRNVYNTHF